MADIDKHTIQEIVTLLEDAESVLFITGAELSATAGVPAYRGVNGLYEVSDQEDGYPVEVSFSGQMLELRPEITWKHIARAEAAFRKAKPNRAYEIVANIEKRFSRAWIFTQNMDGLHRAAGSRNVLEMNGNVHDLACMSCQHWYTVDDFSGLTLPPHCERCGKSVRPEIVLFGELASTSVLDRISDEMEQGFDLVILVGTADLMPDLVVALEECADMGAAVIELHSGSSQGLAFVEHELGPDLEACLEAVWNAL